MNETERRFNKKYITSSEICRTLNVSRSMLTYAKKRGFLPGAIKAEGSRVFIWERDKIEMYLEAWKLVLQTKRRNK